MASWTLRLSPIAIAAVWLASANSSAAQTFSATHTPTGNLVGTGPRGLAVGDLNHDGFPDVVTNNGASTTSGTISVLLGSATGTLGAATATPYNAGTGGTVNGDCFLADFNTDANLDMLNIHASSTATLRGAAVLAGNGLGGFTIPTTAQLLTPVTVQNGTVADFTGDGLPDVVVSSFSSDEFHFFANTGGLTFAAPVFIDYVSPDGTVTGNLGVADVDNDGDLDWASGRFYGAGLGGFAVFNNTGGVFTKSVTTLGSSTSSASEDIDFGDFDGDGDEDAVLQNDVANTLVFFNNTAGVFGPGTQTPLTIGTVSFNTAVGDLDHDGDHDIAVCQQGVDNVQVFLGSGAGTFASLGTVASQINPFQVEFHDMNGDGQLDIVIGNQGILNTTAPTGSVTVNLQTTAQFAGVTQGVASTYGCRGISAMNQNSVATVGNAAFRLTTCNVPAEALGLLLIGDVPAASDYLTVFCVLTVDLLSSTVVVAADAFSGPSGNGSVAVPIPNDPNLTNVTIYAQTIWAEPFLATCVPAPTYGLIGTQGYAFTVQ